MTLWAISVGADLQIHLGDIIVTVTAAFMIWMANRVYRMVAGFFGRMHNYIERVEEHDERLDTTEQMVDRHSRALLKAALIGPPVDNVHHARRSDDPHEQEIRT